MATRFALKHKDTGMLKDGFFGYSWTTLFFGFFPALFRGDFLTFAGGFVIACIIGLMTFGIGLFFISLVWSFFYNKYYTTRLLERGYAPADTESMNERAAVALGIPLPRRARVSATGTAIAP